MVKYRIYYVSGIIHFTSMIDKSFVVQVRFYMDSIKVIFKLTLPVIINCTCYVIHDDTIAANDLIFLHYLEQKKIIIPDNKRKRIAIN